MSVFGTIQIQHVAPGTGVASASITFNTALHDLICVSYNAATSSAISDTIGNQYTMLPQNNLGRLYGLYYTFSKGANASNVVTVFQGLGLGGMTVQGWDVAINGAAVFDTHVEGNTGAGTVSTSQPFTTAGTDELVLSFGRPASGNGSCAAQAGWTADSILTTGGLQHIIFASPQTGITNTFTWSATSAAGGQMALAAFMAVDGTANQANWVNAHRDFANLRGIL